MVMRILIIALCIVSIAGCTTFTMPYEPVTFDGLIKQQSSIPFSISVRTTAGQGGSATAVVPVGGVFVPMEFSTDNELRFDEVDQIQFANNFASELSKLGVLGALVSDDAVSELLLLLTFDDTQHVPSRQKYLLKGSLAVESEIRNAVCPFDVDSNVGQSFGTRMTTNAFEAQKRASQMLMLSLFGCVQNFVASSDVTMSNNEATR